MTPKEKALELVGKFNRLYTITVDGHEDNIAYESAQKCALIAVESHIYNENDSPFSNMDSWVTNGKFWQEVKKEIEAL